ncbi:MAG: FhaA domain-containing protein, partial [Gaiellaceae bacterium]
QPVELARKLAKEMDENKAVSVSRVYAPNEYLLYLSPRDRAQYRQYEEALLQELSTYLLEHAQNQGYALLSRPRVLVEEDADLRVGLFGIATRMVEPKRTQQPAAPVPAAPVATQEAEAVSFSNGPPDSQEHVSSEPQSQPVVSASPAIIIGGQRHDMQSGAAVLGRSQQCDIVVDDAGASRRHAEVRLEGEAWFAIDLGSTNGLYVNGDRIDRVALAHGDVLSIGRTQMRFEC